MASTSLDDLLAVDAIRDVIMDLARGTDRLDAELIRSCYHADALDDHNAFRGGPGEFADWVLANLTHFAATMHFVGNVRIEVRGDVAWSEAYCVAHHLFEPGDPDGERDLVLGLRYFDRFERRSAQWKIALRRCIFDWTYTVPIAEKWPFGADFTVGRRDRSDESYRRE
jgi:ketosteroid isomerase-like protein